MEQYRNILVSPLNWGLGHATRCIPVVEALLQAGKNVIIGGNGESLKLLKQRFPDLIFVDIPAPELRYGTKNVLGVRFFIGAVKMFFNMFVERRKTARIIRQYAVGAIISDNRPGVYSRHVTTIYITHQLNVIYKRSSPLLSALIRKVHRHCIRKYDYCLVPDFESANSLAGSLSQNVAGLPNVEYVGWLSRFLLQPEGVCPLFSYDVLCVVSGLEPQRTIFENLLIDKFRSDSRKVLIIRGLPAASDSLSAVGNVTFVNHCSDFEFEKYLRAVPVVICRSGYSSIMDLAVLGRTAFLVSTPGQPEQEYLSAYLSGRYGFVSLSQVDFARSSAADFASCSPFSLSPPPSTISAALRRILQ